MVKGFIIGIDLGGTNLKIALLDRRYRIIKKQVFSTRTFTKKEDLIEAICSGTNGIIASCGLKRSQILGAGLGVPGPTDNRRGIVHFFPNIPGWREVNLKKILEKKLKIRVCVDNDVKAMTLAEHKLGAARGFKNCLCLTLGTGVGGGIIIENSLFRGADNAAGEIGHLPINEKGPRCNCGGIACLEAYIGNNRILERARKVFGRKVSLEELSALALKKNKKAITAWQEVGRQLGVALTALVNVLNLDAVIIGGGVANAGAILFNRVKETVASRAMSVQAGRVKILKARLGSDAGVIGTAIALEESLK